MWPKIIKTTDNNLWLVAFEGSMPLWKEILFKWNHSTSVRHILDVLSSVEGDISWDPSYLDDGDVAEIPYKKESKVEPIIHEIRESPNQSNRGGTISHIVLHNTAGSYASSVDWLCNKAAKASAHLVIGRDARVCQLVPFDKKAWHAGNGRFNANSIGIEIEATNKQRGMTIMQERTVVEHCKFLMSVYGIPVENIIIHRWVRDTDCPGLIWPTDNEFNAWRKNQFE